MCSWPGLKKKKSKKKTNLVHQFLNYCKKFTIRSQIEQLLDQNYNSILCINKNSSLYHYIHEFYCQNQVYTNEFFLPIYFALVSTFSTCSTDFAFSSSSFANCFCSFMACRIPALLKQNTAIVKAWKPTRALIMYCCNIESPLLNAVRPHVSAPTVAKTPKTNCSTFYYKLIEQFFE